MPSARVIRREWHSPSVYSKQELKQTKQHYCKLTYWFWVRSSKLFCTGVDLFARLLIFASLYQAQSTKQPSESAEGPASTMQALSNQAGKVSGPRRQWTARDAVAQHQSCPAAQVRSTLFAPLQSCRSLSRHRRTPQRGLQRSAPVSMCPPLRSCLRLASQRRANLWLVRSHSRHRPTHCRAASSEELITYEEVVAAAKNRWVPRASAFTRPCCATQPHSSSQGTVPADLAYQRPAAEGRVHRWWLCAGVFA